MSSLHTFLDTTERKRVSPRGDFSISERKRVSPLGNFSILERKRVSPRGGKLFLNGKRPSEPPDSYIRFGVTYPYRAAGGINAKINALCVCVFSALAAES